MISKPESIMYVLVCVGFWALVPVVSELRQADLDNHKFLFWSILVSFIDVAFTIVTVKQRLD